VSIGKSKRGYGPASFGAWEDLRDWNKTSDVGAKTHYSRLRSVRQSSFGQSGRSQPVMQKLSSAW
jgi:hypothetical protein